MRRSLLLLALASAGFWVIRAWHDDVFWSDAYLLATNIMGGVLAALVLIVILRSRRPGFIPTVFLYSLVATTLVVLHDLLSFKGEIFYGRGRIGVLSLLLGGLRPAGAALIPGLLFALIWRLFAPGPEEPSRKGSGKPSRRKSPPRKGGPREKKATRRSGSSATGQGKKTPVRRGSRKSPIKKGRSRKE